MRGTYGSSPAHDTANRLSARSGTRDGAVPPQSRVNDGKYVVFVIYAAEPRRQDVYTVILLRNTGSGRFTLIYHELSTERSRDPVEIQEKASSRWTAPYIKWSPG